jgi:hypothetical protein
MLTNIHTYIHNTDIICTYTHTCIHIYIHIYIIHTYVHTYIHTEGGGEQDGKMANQQRKLTKRHYKEFLTLRVTNCDKMCK